MELIQCKADVCAGGWLEAGAGPMGQPQSLKTSKAATDCTSQACDDVNVTVVLL